MTSVHQTGYDAKPWLAQYPGEVPTQVPPNAPTMLALFRRAIDRVPDHPALVYFDSRLTYAELDALSDGVAAYLTAQGFARGDRLALVLQNVPQFVIAQLGVWKAGGVVVPVNPMYRERELAYVLDDADVRAVICAERSWHEVVAEVVRRDGSPVRIALTTSELDLQARDDPRVLGGVTRRRADGVDDLLEVARAHTGGAPPDPGLMPEDVALVSYTSGTSGVPKGATNTHANVVVNAAGLGAWSGLPQGSAIFALAPLFHITGAVCQIASAVDILGTLVLAYRFEPGVVLDAFSEHEPAYMVGPSTAYMALMAHPDVSRAHFASFRLVYSGGAPLPPAIVDAFEQRFGHYVHNGYGLTETTAPCVSVPAGTRAPVDEASGTLAIGVPAPDTVIRIVDDEGHDLPFGENGEIAVEGPMVVPGYWGKPEETAASMPGGRLLTGDVGFMDPEGWVYVVDRKKDMISASGFKVWPREVEDVLYTHPAVREAAVVGVPDAYRGETVKAYVSLRPGQDVDVEDLTAYCRERMAAYKCPREVEVLGELPKTATGKILRRELRDAARAGSSR
ncbi:MAG: AMP-binding protein [Actinomycetes bacterium]